MVRIGVACPFVLLAVALPAQETATTKAKPKDPFAVVRAARDGDRYRLLLRQFRASEPALGERHEAGPRTPLAEYGGQRDLPAAHWVWVKPYWFLFRDGPEDVVSARSWGPEQACGPPDTPEAGDHGSSYATKEQDAADEWLLLEFAAPVKATKLEVHETFNPGALARVTVFNAAGDELEVWQAKEVAASTEPKRALTIDLPLGFVVERVRLHLQSERVNGWNEIDAVGLHDDQGNVHWAARAEASTTFADEQPRDRFVRAAAVRLAVAPVGLPVRVEVPAVQLQLVADVAVRQQAVELQLLQDVVRAKAKVDQPLQVGRLVTIPVEQPVPLPVEVPPLPLDPTAPAPVPVDPAPAVEPIAPARAAALQAKIAELEAELARLRAELEKVQGAGGR